MVLILVFLGAGWYGLLEGRLLGIGYGDSWSNWSLSRLFPPLAGIIMDVVIGDELPWFLPLNVGGCGTYRCWGISGMSSSSRDGRSGRGGALGEGESDLGVEVDDLGCCP